MKEENLLGIVHPFRKIVVLLNIYMIYITTSWAFEYAAEALSSSSSDLLQIAAVITAIFAPITILTNTTFKMYWAARKPKE